jgi:quercetin dioxygenase-like cupin family protein
MMDRPHFSSKDFGSVPSSLTAHVADRLIHRDVLNSGVTEDSGFSEERRHLVRTVDLPSRTLSMTVGGLEPGQKTRMHRHSYETIIYVVSGSGMSLIEGQEIQWKMGDAFYVPVWAWHQHVNTSEAASALYIACENAPLLQSLGAALREEA